MTDFTDQIELDSQEQAECSRAREFLGKFYVLLRLARSHDRCNQALTETAAGLRSITLALLDESDVARFDVVNDCVFFNSVRLRASLSDFNTLKHFVDEMKSHGIGSVVVDETAEADDFLGFGLALIQFKAGSNEPYKEMQRLMNLEGTCGIEIKPSRESVEEFKEGSIQNRPTKEDAKRSFFAALHIVKEALKDGVSRGKVNPRKVKRVVESVVDNILSSEDSMLALTAIRDYDEYTYHHSFNVCVYSIALGNRLGLPKQALSDLGIAALFHDVGKMDVPHATLNKTENLTDEEWSAIQEHTMSGVKALSYMKKLDRTVLTSMIVAFCHHLNMDRSGYPATARAIRPDALSRIVRIADIYDALTSARSYRMKSFTVAEAMEIIDSKAGKELDPTLCSIFAEVIGVAPETSTNAGSRREIKGRAEPGEVPLPTKQAHLSGADEPTGAEAPQTPQEQPA